MNDVTHDPKVVIDPITDTATTGHEWDGLQELNTPLPRWCLWLFYATIIWAVGYWIVYPAWPFITSYSQGLFGWNSRNAIVSDLDSLRVQRGPMMQKLAGASLDQIVADPQLLDFARAVGKSAFAENCAALEPGAIPISTTITGCGAASSQISSKPSPMACAVMIRTHMPEL